MLYYKMNVWTFNTKYTVTGDLSFKSESYQSFLCSDAKTPEIMAKTLLQNIIHFIHPTLLFQIFNVCGGQIISSNLMHRMSRIMTIN